MTFLPVRPRDMDVDARVVLVRRTRGDALRRFFFLRGADQTPKASISRRSSLVQVMLPAHPDWQYGPEFVNPTARRGKRRGRPVLDLTATIAVFSSPGGQSW